MALDPTIREAVRRLLNAFDQFAAIEGWERDDYTIYVSVNETWGSVNVTLVAARFESNDNRRRWELVDSFLRDHFGGRQVLGMNINLHVQDFEQSKQRGGYSIPRDYIEIHDFLGIEHATSVS